jgi:hypothetical protein
MSKEKIIETSVWIIMIIALLVFVPKNKIREASSVYLFKLLLTFVLGLFVVQMKWIEYPVRSIFPYAHKTSFTFEFFVYPAICVLFILYYPWKKNVIIQLGHFVVFCSVMTILEVLIEHYTQLIDYKKWTWYWTWISLFLTFFLSLRYYIWFFRVKSKQ